MKHGEIATKIFNLDLNLRHNGRESHVAVTTIIITTLIIIVIRDYGRRNRLIGGMMPHTFSRNLTPCNANQWRHPNASPSPLVGDRVRQ
jgi:hypothetical protein